MVPLLLHENQKRFTSHNTVVVPCNRPSPSAQAANFGNVVLVALRNPLTAFPSYHQEKAEKYHGAKEQVKMEEWISFRDQYVGNSTHSPLFQEWKEFILEWRNMEPYHVAMYLGHEEWADETKGVELVKKFAQVLSEEGFPIQYHEDNLACLWYKNILQPTLQKKKKHEVSDPSTPGAPHPKVPSRDASWIAPRQLHFS